MAKTLKKTLSPELVTKELIHFTIGILNLNKNPRFKKDEEARPNGPIRVSDKITEFLTCVRYYSQSKYFSVMKIKEVQVLVNHFAKEEPENLKAVVLKESIKQA